MESVCADQHKLHPSHQFLLTKKALIREVEIPPRKLISRRSLAGAETFSDMFADSARVNEALLLKLLPYDGGDEDEDAADLYSSNHFRMYEFKVRRCTRSRSHDWTDCPFAHPGEKARRRDPRRYQYSGTVCSDFRRGGCGRGDNCEFAHGVFECWLHPARYRTEACKDGKNCRRKICFFAHSPSQLRVLPPSPPSSYQCNTNSPPLNSPAAAAVERNYRNSNHRCLLCHSISASPTSTLMGTSHISPPSSPSLSPPISPAESRSVNWISPVSHYSDRMASVESCGSSQFSFSPRDLSYKELVTELMSSLDAMNVNEASLAMKNKKNLPWVDVCFSNGDDQQQFVLSPSTPSPPGSRSRGFFTGSTDSSSKSFIGCDDKLNDNCVACPDLGWVNDLLT
ncbi:hypothetical protein U1Q18_024666 [Sarracenia purpurea var. burkii]